MCLEQDELPRTGWCGEARLVRVIDADTIEVEITRRVRGYHDVGNFLHHL